VQRAEAVLGALHDAVERLAVEEARRNDVLTALLIIAGLAVVLVAFLML
jgi:uncharacterized membrane protein YqjE